VPEDRETEGHPGLWLRCGLYSPRRSAAGAVHLDSGDMCPSDCQVVHQMYNELANNLQLFFIYLMQDVFYTEDSPIKLLHLYIPNGTLTSQKMIVLRLYDMV